MKVNMNKNVLSIAGALMVLAGCGGGGGGSPAPAPSIPVTTTYSATCADGTTTTSTVSVADATAKCPAVPAPATVVTSVPAATYAANSEELAVFTLFNAERERCGFGLLAQSATLDTSARGHADWLVRNDYSGHYQVVGTPGYTGVSPSDRILAAGYVPSVNAMTSPSESTGDAFSTKSGFGVKTLRGLLNAPYHEADMLRGHRDVGVSVRGKGDLGLPGTKTVLNLDFATKSSQGQQSISGVRTYPCQGSTGIETSLKNEDPNPVPGRNLGANPLGSSVVVVGTTGATMNITTATMTGPGGILITLRAPLTSVNDPNKVGGVSYFSLNEAVLSADAPLAPNTTYQVNVSGTDGITPFSRSFTFTTGL